MIRQPERRRTEPPAFDPNDPRYWDARDLEGELQPRLRDLPQLPDVRGLLRHVSRRCSRASIATSRARRAEGAETLDAEDFKRSTTSAGSASSVTSSARTRRTRGTSELLDFPRLMRARRRSARGATASRCQDRVLGEPQLLGKLGCGPAGADGELREREPARAQGAGEGDRHLARVPAAAVRDASRSRSWLDEARAAARARATRGEVVLFSTCYGDYNMPTIGIAAVRVLEHNGFARAAARKHRSAAACRTSTAATSTRRSAKAQAQRRGAATRSSRRA